MFLSAPLLTSLDVVSLAMTVVNIESPAGAETELADQIEGALGGLPHLRVERAGDTVVAHTDLGREERVVLAGHLDSDPVDEDFLARVEMGRLFGPAASDGKGGVAVMLKLAALGSYARDVTFVFACAADRGSSAWAPTLVVGPTSCRLTVAGEPADVDWDDVAGLAAQGASVGFGPGDEAVAHTDGEFVPTAELTESEHALRTWLQATPATA